MNTPKPVCSKCGDDNVSQDPNYCEDCRRPAHISASDWKNEMELAAELATPDARDRPVKPFVDWGPFPPSEQETAAYNLENGFSITTKETAAIVQMLRLYGWRTDESLQMFLHRITCPRF